MRLSKQQKAMLESIRRLQPVSASRLGAGKSSARTFKSLVDKGLIVESGKGMLGSNYRVAGKPDAPTMKLKPCPYCGGVDQYHDEVLIDGDYEYFLCCRGCCCEGPTADSKKSAEMLWNSRV